MRKKVCSENHWSDLASQLGIDNSSTPDSQTTTDSVEITEEISEIPAEISVQDQSQLLTKMSNLSDIVKETVFCPEPEAFGKGLLEDVVEEVPLPAKKSDGKKRFFERFPKINLLGTIAKESSETVVEGVEPPSLNEKTFTSNKLEKIPTVSDYAAQNEVAQKKMVPMEQKGKEQQEKEMVQNEKTIDYFDTETVFSDIEESPEKIICTEEHTQAIVDILDPWSKIASQVEVLTISPSQPNIDGLDLSDWSEVATIAVAETEKEIEQTEKNTEQSVHSSRDFNKHTKYHHKRQSRKNLPSMFDEPTPESEESAALKNLMELEQYDNDAEKRLRSIFSEEEKTEEEKTTWTTSGETTSKNQYSNNPPKQYGKYYGNTDNNIGNNSENQTERRSDQERKSFTVNEERFNRVEEKPHELVRERGRRGARFEPRETKQEQFNAKNNADENHFGFGSRSENVGTTWDIEEESKPVERLPHKHRRGRNLENNRSNREYQTSSEEPTTNTFETKQTTNEEMDMVQLHKNIPSWDEAIEQLVEHNIARRLQSSPPRNNGGRR
jgi:hypothetical protein